MDLKKKRQKKVVMFVPPVEGNFTPKVFLLIKNLITTLLIVSSVTNVNWVSRQRWTTAQHKVKIHEGKYALTEKERKNKTLKPLNAGKKTK